MRAAVEDEFQFDGSEPSTQVVCGFWRRFMAFCNDVAILGLTGWALGNFFFDPLAHLESWGRLVGFAIALAYFGLLDGRIGRGRTIGKLLVGIRVVDKEGNFLSTERAAIRFILIGIPFFLNGVPLPAGSLPTFGAFAAGLFLYGAGGCIVYLLIFNRSTGQSLHDLAAGSFVVRASGTGPVRRGAIWKGHARIMACWLLTVALLLILVPPLIGRGGLYADLGRIEKKLERIHEIRTVSVSVGVERGTKGNHRHLLVNAFLHRPYADFEDLAERIAAVALADYPQAKSLDRLDVILAYGYDIGIFSGWQYRRTTHSPSDWLVKLEYFREKTSGSVKTARKTTASPGTMISFDREREVFRERIRELLFRQDFDRLEEIASELRLERPRFSSGLPKLNDFYKAVGGEGGGSQKADLDRYRLLLEKWTVSRPDSLTAVIAMIKLYEGYAWQARGSGWGSSVSAEGWKGFNRSLNLARQLVAKAERMKGEDPTLYALAIVMSMGLDSPKDEAMTYLKRGVEIDPSYDPLYIYMADYLLPRWHGSPGELHDFALHANIMAGDEWGDIMYLRVAIVAMLTDRETFRSTYPFSWPRLRRGLRELDRRFPNSSRTLNCYGWLTCRYRDAETAAEILPRLSWGPDKDTAVVWGDRSCFESCRDWLATRKGVNDAENNKQPPGP